MFPYILIRFVEVVNNSLIGTTLLKELQCLRSRISCGIEEELTEYMETIKCLERLNILKIKCIFAFIYGNIWELMQLYIKWNLECKYVLKEY